MGYGKISAERQEILDYTKEEILKRGYPPLQYVRSVRL